MRPGEMWQDTHDGASAVRAGCVARCTREAMAGGRRQAAGG